MSQTAAVAMKISISSIISFTLSYICFAVSTSCLNILSGVGKLTGPDIKLTKAPSSQAASAKAKPIFPELRFDINLTGSIISRVGPAVMRIFFPANRPLLKFNETC